MQQLQSRDSLAKKCKTIHVPAILTTLPPVAMVTGGEKAIKHLIGHDTTPKMQ